MFQELVTSLCPTHEPGLSRRVYYADQVYGLQTYIYTPFFSDLGIAHQLYVLSVPAAVISKFNKLVSP
jgi:hypothetical protein